MKYEKFLCSNIVPEWSEFYLNYKLLKKFISPFVKLSKKYVQSRIQAEELVVTNFTAEEILDFLKFKKYFKILIKHELHKIEVFYMTKLEDLYKKWQLVMINVTILQSSKEMKLYQEHMQALKGAFLILYKEIRILDDYMRVNFVGFRKILKKFEKWTAGFVKSKISNKFYLCVEKTNLDMQQKRLSILAEMMENEYLDQFYNRFTRKQGVRDLKRINQGKTISQSETWFFGLFIGCSMMLLFLIIILINNGGFTIEDGNLQIQFPLFRGMSVLIAYVWLLGWNVYGWIGYHVNYRLIFEFGHHYSHFTQIWQTAAAFTSIFLICFLWFMVIICSPNTSFGQSLDFMSSSYIPLICWAAFGIYLIFPFGNIFNKKGRQDLFVLNISNLEQCWIPRIFVVKVFYEILKSPFIPIKFRMAWVSDQLVSFVNPIKDFLYLICYISEIGSDPTVTICLSKQSFFYDFVFLLALLPQVIRMIQCSRQLYDLRELLALPFFNFIKYAFTALVAIFSYLVAIYPDSNTMLGLWILFAAISSFYSYYWDLKYDWGFLEPDSKHKLLRSKLVYHRVWFYYTAMWTNFLLRLSWVLSISPAIVSKIIRPELFTMIISVLEIFRRSVWNFLRVEKEHVSNCDAFKAVESLKLPFTNIKFECDDSSMIKETIKKVNLELENKKILQRKNTDRNIPSQIISRRSNNNGDLFMNRAIYKVNSLSKNLSSKNYNVLDTLSEMGDSFSDPPIVLDEDIEFSREELIKWKSYDFPLDTWLSEVKAMILLIKTKSSNYKIQLIHSNSSAAPTPTKVGFSKSLKNFKKLEVVPEDSTVPQNEIDDKDKSVSTIKLIEKSEKIQENLNNKSAGKFPNDLSFSPCNIRDYNLEYEISAKMDNSLEHPLNQPEETQKLNAKEIQDVNQNQLKSGINLELGKNMIDNPISVGDINYEPTINQPKSNQVHIYVMQ